MPATHRYRADVWYGGCDRQIVVELEPRVQRSKWIIVITLVLAVPGALLMGCLVHGTLPSRAPMTICFTSHQAVPSVSPPIGSPFVTGVPLARPATPLGAVYSAPPPISPDHGPDELFGRLRI